MIATPAVSLVRHDENTRVISPFGEWRTVEIYGSRMLEVTCNFVADAENAVPGVDANGMMYHLPTSSQVEELVVYDSLNRSYRLAEPIAFLTYRWEEDTPFQPG